MDDRPVWSIVCFFVGKRYRRQGLMVRLLEGAISYAAANGAQIVEGYPVDPGDEQVGGGSTGYVGLASAFRKAGFVEVARPNERRVIMRYYLGSPSPVFLPCVVLVRHLKRSHPSISRRRLRPLRAASGRTICYTSSLEQIVPPRRVPCPRRDGCRLKRR